MKEGARVYGKKHERKYYGRLGRKHWRGNLLRSAALELSAQQRKCRAAVAER